MSQEATNQDGPEITLPGLGDLSSEQFTIMTIDTNGRVKQADDADDAAEPMLGVLQNKPAATDREAVVRISGVAKVVFGATLSEGTWVTCDSTGEAVASVANDNSIGFTIDAGADGEIGRIVIAQTDGYVAPT